MALHQVDNFCFSNLNGAITNVATVIQLPTGGLAKLLGRCAYPIYAVIHPNQFDYSTKEIVELTGSPGVDQATIGRGMDGTSAIAWPDGSLIEQAPVAAHLLELQALFS